MSQTRDTVSRVFAQHRVRDLEELLHKSEMDKAALSEANKKVRGVVVASVTVRRRNARISTCLIEAVTP